MDARARSANNTKQHISGIVRCAEHTLKYAAYCMLWCLTAVVLYAAEQYTQKLTHRHRASHEPRRAQTRRTFHIATARALVLRRRRRRDAMRAHKCGRCVRGMFACAIL